MEDGLWDFGNEGAIYAIMPLPLVKAFTDAKLKRPDLFGHGEQELRKILKDNLGKYPTTTENQMRLRFWLEYDTVLSEDRIRMMSVPTICRGLCDTDLFYSYILQPATAAWIACMPLTYEWNLYEILNFGAHRMREILHANPVDPLTGKVDSRLAKLQAQIYQAAEMRIHGAIPQTVRNLNLTLNGSKEIRDEIEARGSVVIEDKIAALEKKPVVKKPSAVVEEKVEDES